MNALFNAYLDSSFLEWLGGFFPFVGGGLILGLIVAVLGWLFGLVWSLVRIDFD